MKSRRGAAQGGGGDGGDRGTLGGRRVHQVTEIEGGSNDICSYVPTLHHGTYRRRSCGHSRRSGWSIKAQRTEFLCIWIQLELSNCSVNKEPTQSAWCVCVCVCIQAADSLFFLVWVRCGLCAFLFTLFRHGGGCGVTNVHINCLLNICPGR